MKPYPRVEWLRTGVLLAIAGGMLDAYTFLWRGEVLATAETGNIVMMGLNLVQGNWGKAIDYLFPIIAFALGVFASEWAKFHFEGRGDCPQWRRAVLWIEMMIIVMVAFLPLGGGDGVTNIAISFVSALQVSSFRTFAGCAAFTTMCTGNLRNGMGGLSQWCFYGDEKGREKFKLYSTLIGAFIIGVLLCDFLSKWLLQYTVLLAVLPLFCVYLLIRGECEVVYKVS